MSLDDPYQLSCQSTFTWGLSLKCWVYLINPICLAVLFLTLFQMLSWTERNWSGRSRSRWRGLEQGNHLTIPQKQNSQVSCQGTCTCFKGLHVSRNISCPAFGRVSVSLFKCAVQLLVLSILFFTITVALCKPNGARHAMARARHGTRSWRSTAVPANSSLTLNSSKTFMLI